MPTTSSTSATNGSSIALALGSGSGVDTAALVTGLTEAQFSGKTAALTAKADTLTAQISGIAKVQSGITGFAAALSALIKGGSLSQQPTSSNASVLGATALPGGKLSGLSASVEVTRLATLQSATTAASFASKTTDLGTGTLTLTLGQATVAGGAMTGFTAGATAPFDITIDAAHSTLSGVVQAINAANKGVTASIVTDADGTARVALKGQTGIDQGFTLSGSTPELAKLNVGMGDAATTVAGAASNAALIVDGVSVQRASNTISDLIEGVKLTLNAASVGNPVTLGSTTPTEALSQAVSDFVETYNQFHAVLAEETDPVNGTLRADNNVTTLAASLRSLSLTNLVTGGASGAPTSLASIGVATNRDGTLKVNATQLAKALSDTPEAVAAMFADGTGATGAGIGGALSAISAAAVEKKIFVGGHFETVGLTSSTKLYAKAQADIAIKQDDISAQADAFRTRLTQQYSAMEARVAVYKSTMAFLTQQVDAWNAQR